MLKEPVKRIALGQFFAMQPEFFSVLISFSIRTFFLILVLCGPRSGGLTPIECVLLADGSTSTVLELEAVLDCTLVALEDGLTFSVLGTINEDVVLGIATRLGVDSFPGFLIVQGI